MHLTPALIMRRSAVAPVSLLAAELLLQIFHIHIHGSYTQPLGWIRVTHVCHRWRQVALRDSSLWARISGISGENAVGSRDAGSREGRAVGHQPCLDAKFHGDMMSNAELVLSYDTLFEFDHWENILGQICSMLPLSNLGFLSVSTSTANDSVNWDELSQQCKKTHQDSRGWARGVPSPVGPHSSETPEYEVHGKGDKGRRKERNNRDALAQASNNNDAQHVPVFPKLESLSVEMLGLDEQSVPIASERRKAYNVPLKTLSLARCSIRTNHANALKNLVQEFCWDALEGEGDSDETQWSLWRQIPC
ncbi:hypothetical protein BJV74DRAFT_986331 [Russula compacta]|nr:hypothetical protein BJV74DRAFT_986331 [Russula compacta]